MKKTILLGTAVAAMSLFSCGETQPTEEMEATMKEITTEQAALDAIVTKTEGIEKATEDLESSLENL